MDELPSLRPIIKVSTFAFWGIGSLLTLFAAFFILLDYLPATTRISSFLEPKHTYYLFQSQPDSGQVLGSFIGAQDARTEILKNYLHTYHSPLANYADTLVKTADKYSLPWTLLPAIAGKESGFGKIIPFGSFNAWGWGVYTGQNSGANFTSWPEAIETVAKGIRQNYFNKGLNSVEKMEAFYTPSSLERGNTWQNGVNYFIWELENFARH